MSDRVTLEQAMQLLNTRSRNGAPPLLAVTDCDVCCQACIGKFKRVFINIFRDEVVPKEHRMALRGALNEIGVELK